MKKRWSCLMTAVAVWWLYGLLVTVRSCRSHVSPIPLTGGVRKEEWDRRRDRRPETCNHRCETRYRRCGTGDVRHETWDRRCETGDVGQEMWDRRPEMGDRLLKTEDGSLMSYPENLALLIYRVNFTNFQRTLIDDQNFFSGISGFCWLVPNYDFCH